MARVFGLFAEPARAEAAIDRLREAGFSSEDLGLLAPGTVEEPNPLASSMKAAVAAGSVGGIAGGVLGAAVAGLIPGVGPVVAAGSIVPMVMGFFTGAGAGMTAGGLFGASAGDDPLHYYEQEVKAGRTLVSVEAGERGAEAVELLQAAGAIEAAPVDQPVDKPVDSA